MLAKLKCIRQNQQSVFITSKTFFKRTFFLIFLGAAEGEFVHDSADVQRASLTVIINCVCAPISRPNNLGRAATGITGSSVKKKPTGKALFCFLHD